MIIAIDGTTGSGKSTTSQALAHKLGFAHINTGSYYRAIGLKTLRQKIDTNNLSSLSKMLKHTKIETKHEGEEVNIYMDGELMGEQIRTPEASAQSSVVAKIDIVREFVRGLQQDAAKTCPNIIMEGRDIGSVVFPNADLKVFMTCDLHERAIRRAKDYAKGGNNISISDVEADIALRDDNDIHRKNSPLVKLPDAFCVDTTNYSLDQVVEIIYKKIKSMQTKNR